MKLLTVAAAVALTLGVAACSPSPEQAARAAAAKRASTDVHPFRIGALQAWSLRDGAMTIPNDNQALGAGRTSQEVAALLTAAGLPGDTIGVSIEPLLIRDGDRLVLIDTGTGPQMGAGKLRASLTAAGMRPDQVTDILISHSHGDHVGGLVRASGDLAFPNATIRMSAAEWTAAQGYAPAKALVKTIAPRVQTFTPGDVVAPGITSVAINGHTPGHVGYEIVSGSDRLLYVGDAFHSAIISVQRPEWANAWDDDRATAAASRQALLERAASQNLRLYAGHLPWPGLGRVQRHNDGFVWAPETE